MPNTPDLQAAQPTFSDGELEILLRALNIRPDIQSEADRGRALEALTEVLLDAERSQQVLVALDQLSSDASGVESGSTSERTPQLLTRRAPSSDNVMMDDEPSTGRLLNALQAREHATEPFVTAHREALLAAAGDAGSSSEAAARMKQTLSRLAVASAPEHGHLNQEQFAVFLCRARDALPERPPTWLERFADAYEAIRGTNAGRSWQAVSFLSHSSVHHVECQLRHGPREWHIEVLFFEPKVTVRVTNEANTFIERDVPTTKPEDFSRTLLQAFGGDIRSTQVALDTVQQAVALDARALH